MQPWQEEALPYLDKLFDPSGNRQTGRTYLLAVALIRAACRNPTYNIPFIDHRYNDQQARNTIRQYVRVLVRYSTVLRDHYRDNDRHFCLTLQKPIEDWRPDLDWEPGPSVWERLLSD